MASQVLASETIITNRSDFESLVTDKKLERFLISLSVTNDGKIKGSAAGREVIGDWDWIDGFFCRNLLWGKSHQHYAIYRYSIHTFWWFAEPKLGRDRSSNLSQL